VQVGMLLNLLFSFLTTQERVFQLSDAFFGVASASKGNRFPPAPSCRAFFWCVSNDLIASAA